MMNMHAKYDNMHRNGILNALMCINNHVNTSKSYMLPMTCDSLWGIGIHTIHSTARCLLIFSLHGDKWLTET